MSKVCYGDPFCACQGFTPRPGDTWTCDNCGHRYQDHGAPSFPTDTGSSPAGSKVCWGDSYCSCTGFVAAYGDSWKCGTCGHQYSDHR
jgi:rubredoxin